MAGDFCEAVGVPAGALASARLGDEDDERFVVWIGFGGEGLGFQNVGRGEVDGRFAVVGAAGGEGGLGGGCFR